jgi:hypothetical protein
MSTSTIVCDSCAVVLVNADTSHIHDEWKATVDAFVESIGLVSPAGTVDMGGYWRCPCCGDDVLGDGHRFETLTLTEDDSTEEDDTAAILSLLNDAPKLCLFHGSKAQELGNVTFFTLAQQEDCVSCNA